MLKHKLGHILFIAVLAVVVVGTVGQVAAATLQNVAESYRTDRPLQQGMIVQLDSKAKSTVSPASYEEPSRMFGVTVAPGDTPVSLSSEQQNEQAYVVTSGRYDVLVNNQNGSVRSGDYVSISAVAGIGMKAQANQDTVFGRAVGSFNGKDNVLSTTKLTLDGGKQTEVAIGSILVDVSVQSNPNYSGSGGVPAFAQNAALDVIGQPINAAQLYGSLLILLLGVGVVAVLIYSGIQTSMAAIGRNPLAKRTIMRNMLQVVIIAMLIFIGCLIAVYLILKL